MNPVFAALDTTDLARAKQLAALVGPYVGGLKLGLEFFLAQGLANTAAVAGSTPLFLDLKLHDIPNTVAGAMRGIARMGVWSVTVHTMGGPAMLRVAADSARDESLARGIPGPKVLGVTVLTSIDPEMLRTDLQVAMPLAEFVPFLARQAYAAGCAGVIASPLEIEAVREAVPDPDFLIITPGVRPLGADKGDQARVMTPGEAIRRGASCLVIGRPIVGAPDPVEAAQRIAHEIAQVQ